MKKDLLSIRDLSKDEITSLIELALRLKKSPSRYAARLAGKGLGLLFQKPSARTRVSFEAGMAQLGGYTVYLAPDDIRFGEREEIRDLARCFSRYLDVVVIRTFAQSRIEEFAAFSSIPVINGLTDLLHPCQALGDGMTLFEAFGKLKGIELAYIGDGNNVAHSLLYLAGKMGMNMRIATPQKYVPLKEIMDEARRFAKESGSTISYTTNPHEAVKGAEVVYTDVWTSMGREHEHSERIADFEGFQLTMNLLRLAKKGAHVMHCLPAHRGEEITDEVMESPRSLIFPQAENRLHMQKAILLKLLTKR